MFPLGGVSLLVFPAIGCALKVGKKRPVRILFFGKSHIWRASWQESFETYAISGKC